jgi:transcriptional regulator with XRE-family HTH domain
MLIMDIGQRISELISKNNLTKKEVCSGLRISRPTLDDYINNRTEISVSRLIEFCEYIKVDVREFFSEGGERTQMLSDERIIDQFAKLLKEKLSIPKK